MLRRARALLVDAAAPQFEAVAAGLWGLVPRALLDRHDVGPADLERLVCGDANGLEVEAWRAAARAEGAGDPSGARLVAWFWDAVAALAPDQQRLLLQFWSGSDSVPVEGLASLDPPFTLRLVGLEGGGGAGGGDNGSGAVGGSESRALAGGDAEPSGGQGADGASGSGGGGERRRLGRFAWPWGSSGSLRRTISERARRVRSGGTSTGAGAAGDDAGASPAATSAAPPPDAAGRTPRRRALRRLPSAHTCGRVLELPRYSSAAEVAEALGVVLSWAREGMGLA